MQNFTTTLHNDLVNKERIFLLAGNAKFTSVDVTYIGTVTNKILFHFTMHQNKCYELTSNLKLTFKEMAQELGRGLGIYIT